MKTKNASRSNWIVAGLIGCALVLYGVSNPSLIGLPHTDVGAEELNYSLPFTSSHNQFTTSSTEMTSEAVTTAGSAISFTYSGLTQTAGTWETMAQGGYFYNTTPISGLKTISFAFGDTNGISLSYGWQSSPGVNNYWVTGVALDSLTNSYAFQNDRPDCFKIENTSGTVTASITSFTLTYSCSATSDPYSGTAGLSFALVGGTSYSVSRYSGSSTVVVIPSRYLGKNVTAIGSSAFQGCTSLTSVAIPSSVTSIGDAAFYNCTSAASIEIPSGVTSISEYTFYGCSSLTSITIPSGVASIGTLAFYGCSSLTSIMIPSTVISIADWAFYNCYNLASITIPDCVTLIGAYAFASCFSLTINCQATSQPVGWDANWNPSSCPVNWALSNTEGLQFTLTPDETSYYVSGYSGSSTVVVIRSQYLGKNVTSIGAYAFYGCSSLTSITISSGVTSIGDYAFYRCSNLTSITIPSSVTSIGVAAFVYCNSLTWITIPSSVTSIGAYAFYGCSSLTSITIPSGVTSIGTFAFYNCTLLTINCQATSRPVGWDANWNPSGCYVNWAI